MEIIIAVLIAICGWIVNHLLTIRAQKKSFYNNLQNEARMNLASALRNYLDWIDEVSNSFNSMRARWVMADDGIKQKINLITFSNEFRSIVDKQTLRLVCHDLLEECEPLFPNTVEARNHLWKNHAKIFSELHVISSFLRRNKLDIPEIEKLMESEIGSFLAAQRWFVRDLIICIQNIALCKITNQTITTKEYPFEIKHTRLKTNKKLDIVFVNKKENE